MAAATATVTFSPSPPSFLNSHIPRGHRPASTTTIAFARRFRGVKPSPDRSRGKVDQVAHPDDGFGALEAELWRLRRLVELKIHRLGTEADAAYRDLRSAVREVSGDRVVLTFRRSSLRYLTGALLFLLACAIAARLLLGMVLRAWQRRGLRRGLWGEGGRAVVRRRDRSLGGKEVVVAVSSPPKEAARTSRVAEPAKEVWRGYSQAKLPDWWPNVGATVMEPGPEMEKWARMANRLVRAIIDSRVMGRDYRYDDAIQVACKFTGNVLIKWFLKSFGLHDNTVLMKWFLMRGLHDNNVLMKWFLMRERIGEVVPNARVEVTQGLVLTSMEGMKW
ncbi:hypothetical protein ZEAMMB73_Zm00001d010456 [Zea mays]|uniref:Uncharacterized protein n=1 Tax=Zea mays TaxID=4577 RepID=K7VW02_MAIZE|nr:hypothetical protein ZEAMMB73_Zm00001d010456 [Zea mays]AQK94093.1 hypothetical protein ZEAMMB73_Zm00001d010456 [Zea mays]